LELESPKSFYYGENGSAYSSFERGGKAFSGEIRRRDLVSREHACAEWKVGVQQDF